MKKMLVALIILGGCTSKLERARSDCSEYGYQPGTVEFSQCMQVEVSQAKAASAAAWANFANQVQAQQRAQAAAQALRNQSVTINRGYGW